MTLSGVSGVDIIRSTARRSRPRQWDRLDVEVGHKGAWKSPKTKGPRRSPRKGSDFTWALSIVGGFAFVILAAIFFAYHLSTRSAPHRLNQLKGADGLLARPVAPANISITQWNSDGSTTRAFRVLTTTKTPGGIASYHAGSGQVVAWDSLATALLLDNAAMLSRILEVCVASIGTKYDHLSGEEPGKVFHELPGMPCTWCTGEDGWTRELNTAYNAIDTTPLFIIAAARYFNLVGSPGLMARLIAPLTRAMAFVKRHTNGTLYQDTTAHIAKALRKDQVHFALPVTYAKAATIEARQGSLHSHKAAPVYPVVYTLVQVQCIAAVRAYLALMDAAQVPYDPSLRPLQRRLLEGLRTLTAVGAVAVDALGPMKGSSTDLAHALWYLDVGDVARGLLSRAEAAVHEVVTPLGYAVVAHRASDRRHRHVVWPVEQAFIHAAARRHRLREVETVALRCARALAHHLHHCGRITLLGDVSGQPPCFPELLEPAGPGHSPPPAAPDIPQGPPPAVQGSPKGRPIQLSTVAAAVYFARRQEETVHLRGLLMSPVRPFGVAPELRDEYEAAILSVEPEPEGRLLLIHPKRALGLKKASSAKKREQRLLQRLWGRRMMCLDRRPVVPHEGEHGNCRGDHCVARVNDDYCDCSDGSDEPGTAACDVENDLFYCRDGGELVHHSVVGDGICDCCDGSDEQSQPAVPCPYSCRVVVKEGTTLQLHFSLSTLH